VKILFDPCTGVNTQVAGDPEIHIQPNPSDGIFELIVHNCGNMTADVRVTDLLGHVVFHQSYDAPGAIVKKQLDLSFLSKGSYLLTVRTAGGSQVKSIIISGNH
jgi:hypothetical protein